MIAPPDEVDLLVVGGGPAGAVAAAEAAGLGLSVLLVEASPEPADKVCGEFIGAEVRPLLERYGILRRVGDDRIPRLRRARFTAGRADVSFDLPGEAAGLRRRVLDEALRAEASRRGASVLRGARFLEPLRDGDGVAGARLALGGDRFPVRCCLLVGADGRGSTVARSLGLDRPARGVRRCAIKAHFHLRSGADLLDGVVEVHLFDGGYVGVQPVDGGLVNVSAVIDERLARSIQGGALRILLESSRRSPSAADRLRGAEAATPPVSLFPLDRRRSAVQGPGFLLAGDAAAVVPPFAGLGIAAAMRSGLLAARAAGERLVRAGGRRDAGSPGRRPAVAPTTAAGSAPRLPGGRRGLEVSRRRSRWLERVIHRPALAEPLLELLGPATAAALARATRLR